MPRAHRGADPLALMAVWGFVALFAVVFGVAAASANLIVVLLLASMLIGAGLVSQPIWLVWICLFGGLIVVGPLPIWAESIGGKLAWGVSILGFLILARTLLSVSTAPKLRLDTPGFVWLALGFLLYAALISLVRFESAWQYLGGFKRYFQVWGILFALAWLPIDERTVVRWRAFVIVVALLQLPFAVYELMTLVPFRRAVVGAYPGMVPIDVVAGTFGSQRFAGGANAEMAAFLILVLAFLVARYRAGLLSLGRLALASPFLLSPLFLGETKVVVILFPLAFFVLFQREILSRPHVAIMGVVLSVAVAVSAGYVYLSLLGKSPEKQLRDTIDYNFGDRGYGSAYLNRTTVITHWVAEQGMDDPVSAVLGNGLGASHDVSGGRVAKRYPGYRISLTAASTLLWDLGVIGAAMFFGVLALAWRTAGRLRKAARDAWVRADAAGIQSGLALFGIFVFYRNALLETMTFQIVFALVLGYLAWLHKREASGIARAGA